MLKQTHVSNAVDVLSILRVICSTGADLGSRCAPPCSSLRLRLRNTGALSSGHMTAFGVNSSADWMKVFGACCVVLV